MQAEQQNALGALDAQAVQPVEVLARRRGRPLAQPLQVKAAVLGLHLVQKRLDPAHKGTGGHNAANNLARIMFVNGNGRMHRLNIPFVPGFQKDIPERL